MAWETQVLGIDLASAIRQVLLVQASVSPPVYKRIAFGNILQLWLLVCKWRPWAQWGGWLPTPSNSVPLGPGNYHLLRAYFVPDILLLLLIRADTY